MDEWKEDPSAVFSLYFVYEDKFEEILAGGFRDLSGDDEGFLKGIPSAS